jgi:predicted Zn-dependent peptidase
LRECRRLAEGPVDGEELQGTKEQLKGSLLLSMEHTENRTSRLGKNEIYYGRTLSVEEILANIDRVRVEDIQDLARQIFQPQFFALAMLGAVQDEESITPDIFQEELGLSPSR